MEVVSTEQLLEPLVSPLVSDQLMEASGISKSNAAVSEDLPQHHEWGLAPSGMSFHTSVKTCGWATTEV